MDWLHLLAPQGTVKSLLQRHSSKASTLLCSAFFIVQFSHQYMTTAKTIALTRRTFVSKFLLSVQLSSVSQSCSTLCDPHGMQHTRPPCPSPTPGVYSNSCPLSVWSKGLFSFCLPGFISHNFTSSGFLKVISFLSLFLLSASHIIYY